MSCILEETICLGDYKEENAFKEEDSIYRGQSDRKGITYSENNTEFTVAENSSKNHCIRC